MDDIIDNQYHRDCFFDSGNENWDWQNLSKKSHNNITNGKELSMDKIDEIIKLAEFHSFDIAYCYTDETVEMEKAITIEKLRIILNEVLSERS